MRAVIITIVLALVSADGVALPNADAPIIRTVDIGHGITLHYTEAGKGTPVIFAHGSLSDGGYWADQIGRSRIADGTTIRIPIRPAPDTRPSLMRRTLRHSFTHSISAR